MGTQAHDLLFSLLCCEVGTEALQAHEEEEAVVRRSREGLRRQREETLGSS